MEFVFYPFMFRTLDTMRRELALLKEMVRWFWLLDYGFPLLQSPFIFQVVVCAAKGDQQEGGSK
jgi:hypothetical protein